MMHKTISVEPQMDASLLAPEFEGFRLAPSSHAATVLRTRLSAPPMRRPHADEAPLRILELCAQTPVLVSVPVASTSHASKSGDENMHEDKRMRTDPPGEALFLDNDRNIVLMQASDTDLNVKRIHKMQSLSQSSARIELHHHLPPSICCASRSTFVVSDGSGTLEIVHADSCEWTPDSTRSSSVHLEYTKNACQATPVVVLAAAVESDTAENATDNLLVCLLRVVDEKEDSLGDPNQHVRRDRYSRHVQFVVDLIQISLTRSKPDGYPETITVHNSDVLLSLRGEKAPQFVRIEPKTKAVCVGAQVAYKFVERCKDASAGHEKSQDQEHVQADDERVPLYTWTQTHDEVTVVVNLPKPASSSGIRVNLQAKSISIQMVADHRVVLAGQLFDVIDVCESLWTLEGCTELTVHLTKKHDGTRWTHVFEDDDGVLETVDASEMVRMREKLEKYHGNASVTSELKLRFDSELDLAEEGEPIALVGAVQGGITHESDMAGFKWIGNAGDKLVVCVDADACTIDVGDALSMRHIGSVFGFARAALGKVGRVGVAIMHADRDRGLGAVASEGNVFTYDACGFMWVVNENLVAIERGGDRRVIGVGNEAIAIVLP